MSTSESPSGHGYDTGDAVHLGPRWALRSAVAPRLTYARELTDTVLRDEIELVADLVVAAAAASAHRDYCQIDERLTVCPRSQRATA